jgi:hypothetical protein
MRLDFTENSSVLIRSLKVAICFVALGWGVAPASADVHRYLYELSTKSGESLYAGEVPAGAKSPTKCADVTTDGLGRITQVVRQVNGKMTSETIYQFVADAKLPSGFETIAANGERISENRIQRNDHGDRVRIDQFTMAGELAEYVIRKVGPDSVEEITYTAIGNPQGDRVENYYSPAGLLVRSRDYASGSIYYEDEYDVSTGLMQSEKKFENGGLGISMKITYGVSGEILRKDLYSGNSLWYGEAEYADDLLMVRKYQWPGGRTADVRFSYDDKRQPKEATIYYNDQLVCVLKYDRFSTGAIKRTIARGANGRVFAVYPGLEVDEIDQWGHALDHPDIGTIYKEGNWWSRPMMSFGRADGDGAMP